MMDSGEGPRLWSAEEPHLYVLVLSLLNKDKSLIEAESCQVLYHPICRPHVLHSSALPPCSSETQTLSIFWLDDISEQASNAEDFKFLWKMQAKQG